jgi:hypothetical protein
MGYLRIRLFDSSIILMALGMFVVTLTPGDRSWASTKAIEIGEIRTDKESPVCGSDCDIKFTVSAKDPEFACPPPDGDSKDNDVKVEWQKDSGAWETGTPAQGQGDFEKTYTLNAEKCTIRAKATELNVPNTDCEEEDIPDHKIKQKEDFCVYNITGAFVDDQNSPTYTVDCGATVHITATVDYECPDLELEFEVLRVNEFGVTETVVAPELKGPREGVTLTVSLAGNYTATVKPAPAHGRCETCNDDKVVVFKVNCSCEGNCCGSAAGDPEFPPGGEDGLNCPCTNEPVCGGSENGVKWRVGGECEMEVVYECIDHPGHDYWAVRFGHEETPDADKEIISCCIFPPGAACECDDESAGEDSVDNLLLVYKDECGRITGIYHENARECVDKITEEKCGPAGKKIVNYFVCRPEAKENRIVGCQGNAGEVTPPAGCPGGCQTPTPTPTP